MVYNLLRNGTEDKGTFGPISNSRSIRGEDRTNAIRDLFGKTLGVERSGFPPPPLSVHRNSFLLWRPASLKAGCGLACSLPRKTRQDVFPVYRCPLFAFAQCRLSHEKDSTLGNTRPFCHLYAANKTVLLSSQVRILENRLDKALTKFNEALAHNKTLRQEVGSPHIVTCASDRRGIVAGAFPTRVFDSPLHV